MKCAIRIIAIPLIYFSYLPFSNAETDEVEKAEYELMVAKAHLAEAEAKVAKAKRIAELRRELAQLEGSSPAPIMPRTTAPMPTLTSTPLVAEASPPAAQAPVAAVPEAGTKPASAEDSDAEKNKKIEEATRKFGGLELGAGLSFTLDVGDRDRVTEARVVNDVVRITNADNVRARLMFESHYFFKPKGKFLGLDEGMWGVGPFVAIQPGSDEIIEAIGLGAMIGFRRAPDDPQSFNFGVGVVFDPNTQVLGDDVLPNKPLPAGETEIRYKEDSQMGLMAIASFTF